MTREEEMHEQHLKVVGAIENYHQYLLSRDPKYSPASLYSVQEALYKVHEQTCKNLGFKVELPFPEIPEEVCKRLDR